MVMACMRSWYQLSCEFGNVMAGAATFKLLSDSIHRADMRNTFALFTLLHSLTFMFEARWPGVVA